MAEEDEVAPVASEDEVELVKALDKDLTAAARSIRRYDQYYEGEQPLRYMHPVLEAEVGDRISQLVVNFPRVAVEAYEHRLDIDGFRTATKGLDKRIREWWQIADGDELSQLANQESVALARSYVIIGAGDDNDPPIMSVEHPLQCITRRNPRTRATEAGLKRWKERDGTQCAQLYTANATITFDRRKGKWSVVERDDHGVGRPLIEPIVNHPRILRPDGRSEIHDIIPLADATNKLATDMMLASEFHAIPRLWAMGFDVEDFVDEHGDQISPWSMIMGRIWGTQKGPDEAKFGQFDESDLKNFHDSIRLLAQLIASMLALPPSYVDASSQQPAKAEGVKAMEARTIKRAERMQSQRSGPWEQVVRTGMRLITGRWEPKAKLIETIWRDAATPTLAEAADASVKLVQAKIIPRKQSWEDLHYSEEAKLRMEGWFTEEARQSLAGLAELGVGVKPELPADDDAAA